MNLLRRLSFIFCLVSGSALASQLTGDMTATEAERYRKLTAELRCLVCQNQNIADSNAPLAQDLRQQVLTMIEQGKSDDEIKAYLVDRYGDFVLYRPPLKPSTWLLWGSPFLLLLIAMLIAWRIVTARRSLQNHPTVDTEAVERALHEDDAP